MSKNNKTTSSDPKDTSRPMSVSKKRDISVEDVLLWEAT